MFKDTIPVWLIFILTILIVAAALEIGFKLGRRVMLRTEDEKKSQVATIEAAVLGLLAFMLAFTFGMVSERYQQRKALVYNEANAIRTAWLRSDFLPELPRNETRKLLIDYVDIRLAAIQSRDIRVLQGALPRIENMQRELWEIASVNAARDLNSDVAALYLESLDEVINYHAMRVTIGLQTKMPASIWLVLYTLIVLGMLMVGYHGGISSSRRSWTTVALAISFALVIALIMALDRPDSSALSVSQQPLLSLKEWMTGK